MNCLEFEAQLQSAIEAHQQPQEGLLADHARHCRVCRHEWDEYQLLAQAIASWNEATPAVDLSDTIVARWLLETTGPVHFGGMYDSSSQLSSKTVRLASEAHAFGSRENRRLRSGRVVWIPATLLMLFFILMWQGNEQPENRRLTDVQSARKVLNSPADERPSASELETLLQDVESGYWELASSAATTVSDAADLLPMRRGVMRGDPLVWPAIIPSRRVSESAELPSTEENAGPLRQGFSKAFDLLLEVVPSTELPTT